MSRLAEFRAAIRTRLADQLDIDFIDGIVEGPVTRGDLGCVYGLGKTEDEEHVMEELLTLGVRVFQKYDARQREPTRPFDSTQLEDWVDEIQEALDDNQVATAGVWYYRVPTLAINYEVQMVEAEIVGRNANVFT